MESQPQNPEFRIYPESFHPCAYTNIENLAKTYTPGLTG